MSFSFLTPFFKNNMGVHERSQHLDESVRDEETCQNTVDRDPDTYSYKMADYASILGGGTFTFEIGTNKTPFTIHKDVVERHSPALAAMMNNGHMLESTLGTAQLPDVEPQTFALFAEYAYTGLYRIVNPCADESPRRVIVYCSDCDATYLDIGTAVTRYTCVTCSSSRIIIGDVEAQRVIYDFSLETLSKDRKNRYITISQGQDTEKRKYLNIFGDLYLIFNNGTDSLTSLKKLRFPALDKAHQNSEKYLAGNKMSNFATEPVSTYAKLYVFAQTYMIDTLRDLCLHKVHRDLIAFRLNVNSVAEICELISFTYDNTSATGSDKKTENDFFKEGIGEALRLLVMTYAIYNAKKLLDFVPFQLMLQDGGELVTDFIRGVTKNMMTDR